MELNQPIVPDEHLFENVQLGHKAEQFLKHDPLGRKLADRALFEWKNAVCDFEAMDIAAILKSPEKVAAIRQRMDVARSFLLWMNESIIDAERAEKELENRDMSEELID